MSFSGSGRPLSFRRCFRRPYSRATSRSHETMALPAANRSTLAVFSSGRPDFAAPKNNSPSATAGMNTSGARSRLDSDLAAKRLAGTLDLDGGPIADFDAGPVLSMYRRAVELHLKVLVLGDGGNFLPTKPD